MNTDVQATPGFLDAFIDFHSTVPDYTIDPASDPANNVWGRPDDFTYVDPADANTDWFVNLHHLQPNLLTEQDVSGSYTSTGYARRVLDKRAAGVTPRVTEVTLETAFSWNRNIDYYHDLGEKVGIAFYEAWVAQVAGDFTGDGIVDMRDYVMWRDEVGQTGSALAGRRESRWRCGHQRLQFVAVALWASRGERRGTSGGGSRTCYANYSDV